MPTLTLLSILLVLLHSLPTPTLSQPESLSLLTFKTHADLDNKLTFPSTLPYCQWQGVKCQQSHIIRLSFKSLSLRGTFPPHSLSSLTHLRVLVLRNNTLSGPIPNLSSLLNLRSLLLDHNLFSTTFPYSILSLYTLRVLDLSFNNLSSNLPTNLLNLTRLSILRLQFNHFDGVIPPLNQSFLEAFNISWNNLTGEIPNTPTLSQFPLSSFEHNFNLCGHVIGKPCAGALLEPSESVLSPPVNVEKTKTHQHAHAKKIGIFIGVSLGGLLLVSCFLCWALATLRKKQRMRRESGVEGDGDDNAEVIRVMRFDSDSQGNEKWENNNINYNAGVKRENGTSGNLVFCKGEEKLYTLEQLMKGSAEMLGRGTMGTTYKAKLDNQLILTVKRLDAMKMSGINGEVFEKHMSVVGQLRHPNLVPIRAYFQAKEERLIIYDYQPNGSVFSLIHGSRSTRAKPLHWTSCLKIAEDVAEGLAFIHQASKLIHGNLKASNVLLGADFEACITDYCLATLAAASDDEDPDSARYRGPEARKSGWKATPKSDVYAFGILLLELLSGKPPSQHPFLAPPDLPNWVKATRGIENSFEHNQLEMLVEVASLCSLTSPEQRPTMWQVLKLIQNIKATVSTDDYADLSTGYL